MPLPKKNKTKTLTQEMLADIEPKQTIKDDEVKKHNSEESMWVAIHGKVFDLTDFYMDHPGGYDVIEAVGGKDASSQFEEGGHDAVSIRDLKKYYIGEYEAKKLSLQEMKAKAAQDQIEYMKKEKQLEQGR